MAGRARDFNLPRILHDILLRHCDWNALLIMHNDAIVQGLSQVPFMKDIKHWGVLTIGTDVDVSSGLTFDRIASASASGISYSYSRRASP